MASVLFNTNTIIFSIHYDINFLKESEQSSYSIKGYS